METEAPPSVSPGPFVLFERLLRGVASDTNSRTRLALRYDIRF